jgi:hypothetical protein
MSWEGKPKWNGEYADVKVDSYRFFPMKDNEPLFILLEGTEDTFFMIFSEEEKLRETTTKFLKNINFSENGLVVGQIKSQEFLDVLIEMGIRIMCDPVVIDEHHTKWTEIVRRGDVYKYVDAENN